MDLNSMARRITLAEGGKVNLSIAQVKEVMRLTMRELAAVLPEVAQETIRRYRPKPRR